MTPVEQEQAPPRFRGERASEQECQAEVVKLARMMGYRVLAIRPARGRGGRWETPIQGDPGYPDLTLAHPRAGLIFVELKRHPNKLEPAQSLWRDALKAAGGRWRLVWVPEGLQAFLQWLADEATGR